MPAITEEARLAAVRRYQILDTPREPAFDRMTRHVARVLNVPVALMTVIDARRIWIKSSFGTDLQETEREWGFCASCILQNSAWLVPDALANPATATHSLVSGAFGLRFYLGVPLRAYDGANLGTLCAIDRVPRTCTKDDIAHLTDLAEMIMDKLELRLIAEEVRLAYAAELIRREQREERITALNRELAHRSKNLLARMLSIVRQTAVGAPSLDAFVTTLSHRVQGLARTYDLVREEGALGATLAELAKRHVEPFLDAPEQLRLVGPCLVLLPAAAQSIGLALHELAHESLEHGALSEGGAVTFQWRMDPSTSEVHLTWTETHAGRQRSAFTEFAQLVLERLTPQALEGMARFVVEGAMTTWTVSCAAQALTEARTTRRPAQGH